jgi:hypothetical protein
VRYQLEGGRPTWLQGGRVVPLNGTLEPKEIYYTFERVVVAGANVVNNGQQKFFPSKIPAEGPAEAAVPVELLFYRARFRLRDAFFGFPIGQGIRLVWPNGRVEHYSAADEHVVSIPALPRGEYQVAVEGRGVSLGGPVTLSKDQDVEVALLSYIDISVVAFVLTLALGLPLARRRHLFARGRLHAHAHACAGDGRPATPPGHELVAKADSGQPAAEAHAGNGSSLASRVQPYTAKIDELGALPGIDPTTARLDGPRDLVEPR